MTVFFLGALLLLVALVLVFSPRDKRTIYLEPRLTGGAGVAVILVVMSLSVHSMNARRAAVRALATVIDIYPRSSFTTVPSLAEAHGLVAVAAALNGDTAKANRNMRARKEAELHPVGMWIAEVHDSVPVVVSFYRAAAERGGWSPLPELSSQSAGFANLAYVRGAQQLTIGIMEEWTCTRIIYTLEPAGSPG